MAASALLSDTLARFVFERSAVRGAVVSLDDACRDILGCHPYPPALKRALAELLAAATLLASTLKFKGALIVQLQGDGPVRLLVVECDAMLTLRATAQWNDAANALSPDASLAELAGGPDHGRLAITLDPKDGGPLYQGIVALAATSIAALVEHYLTTSEQIVSRMVLATDATRVRGLLLQRLPGATSDDDATWADAAAHLGAIEPADLTDPRSAEALLRGVFPADDLRLFRPRPVRFALQLLGGTRGQCAANDRPHRGRKHPRRAGIDRRHLRILQSQLHVRRRRGARAVCRGRRQRGRARQSSAGSGPALNAMTSRP